MKPSEIIARDALKRGLDPQKLLENVHGYIVNRHAILLHHGMTALLLEPIDHKTYATHLFTEDPPLSLAKALMDFFKKIHSMGIHTIYGNADNPYIIKFMQKLESQFSARVEQSDRSGYNWKVEL